MPLTLGQVRTAAIDSHRAGQHDQALVAYSQYLNVAPLDAQMWSNFGALLRVLKQYQNAERAQRRAYALDPKSRIVRGNLANILSDMGKFQDSIDLRRSILAEDDSGPEHHALIGRCLRGMGRYAEAVDYLEPLIDRFPDYGDLGLQLAMSLLAMGDYERAAVHYRSRWKTGELRQVQSAIPEWNGEDLTGKTVVVLPEQGFGDCVLMARHLPDLKSKGAAKVVLIAERPLARLLRDVPGADVVTPSYQPDGTEDFRINMMDLFGVALRSDADMRPPTRLSVPPEATQRAKHFVAPYGDRFKVGVVWTGSVTYRANAFRSFSHTDFLPLADVPDVQLFSLYKGPMIDAFRADGSAGIMVDAGSSDADFADCAAMMQELDLVITSDTATAHIAGSLGIPTWVVLHWDAFWVYRHTGQTTPWYPSMRLFRQAQALDWRQVMSEVRSALQEVVHG